MKRVYTFWLIALFVKCVVAVWIPLAHDEAYYWVWAQRLQLSYFDHPPFVAWLMTLGKVFEPWGHAVRWPTVLMGHCTALIWFHILRRFVDWQKMSWWLFLCLASPMLGLGSILVTPDVPVIFFWSLSLLFLLRTLENSNLKNYTLLGASLGLGFCSKYHIVLFVPILLVALTCEKLWNKVSLKGVLAAVGSGLLFCFPVLIWNYQNDWASFKFQINHGLGENNWEAWWTVGYILAQVLAIGPLIFWKSLRPQVPGSLRILIYFAWGPLLFFLYSSTRAVVEINWPIISYPALLAIALFSLNRHQFFASIAIWICVTLTILFNHRSPFLPFEIEKLSEPYHFKPMLAFAEKYQPLYLENYQTASYFWYSLKSPYYKLHQMSRPDFFDTFPESRPSIFPFYVAGEGRIRMPAWVRECCTYKEIERTEDNFAVVEVQKR